LDLLAELLLRPAFAETRVQWAKKLAQDALRREEDDPQALAFRELRRALYRGHPRGIVATPQTLDAVTRDDLTALQARLVAESAWTVGAVGDFNREELLERLNARFGMLKGDSAIFGPIPPPSAPAPRLVIVPKALPQTTLLWAAFGPDAVSPERAAVQVADYVLGGGGFQSRLTREVRSERGLAYDVESFYNAYPGFGVLGSYASTASATAPEVWRILTDQIEKAGSASFGEGEVRWARRTIENRHIFRFRDPADLVRERMSLEIQGLPPDLTERLYKDIEGLTPEAVNHAASGYYHTVRGVWVLVGEVSPEDPAWKGVWSVETVARPAEK
jgi:zinc protease